MKIAQLIGCGAELFLLGMVGWSYRFGTGIGIVATIAWMLLAFGVLSIAGWDISHPPDPARPQQPKQPRFANLIGTTGMTLSALKPDGKVGIGGERIEATSSFGYIEPQTHIRVVGARGSLVVVEEEKGSEPAH